MPELPASRRKRFIGDYGLREYDAEVLTATRAMSEYFERGSGRERRCARRRQLGDGRSLGSC